VAIVTPPQPPFSKSKVDRAGKVLRRRAKGEPVEGHEYREALEAVNYWRDCHGEAIRSANMGLRSIAKSQLGIERPKVTERHKRIEQIENKLGRESSRLTQMQDIAGARLVVTNLRDVLLATTQVIINHHRRNPDGPTANVFDYLWNPKTTGYRSIHVVTSYRGRTVECQIRTELQNLWANLVETIGGELDLNLKAGDGPEEIHSQLIQLAEVLADIDREGLNDRNQRRMNKSFEAVMLVRSQLQQERE